MEWGERWQTANAVARAAPNPPLRFLAAKIIVASTRSRKFNERLNTTANTANLKKRKEVIRVQNIPQGNLNVAIAGLIVCLALAALCALTMYIVCLRAKQCDQAEELRIEP